MLFTVEHVFFVQSQITRQFHSIYALMSFSSKYISSINCVNLMAKLSIND